MLTNTSGKTLGFLIPVIEKLYRSRYSPLDGPGAIVLGPTRELQTQVRYSNNLNTSSNDRMLESFTFLDYTKFIR